MEKLTVDLSQILLQAFGVMGLISWAKSLRDTFRKKKGLDSVLMALIASAIVGFSIGGGNIPKSLTTTWILLAFVELGYTMVIQTVMGLLNKLSGPPSEK